MSLSVPDSGAAVVVPPDEETIGNWTPIGTLVARVVEKCRRRYRERLSRAARSASEEVRP
jgi:hypothetical protein